MDIMRLTGGRVKPGAWDQFEAAYRRGVAEVGHITGLKGRWLIRDINDPDAGTTVSIWDSLASLENYEKSQRAKVIIPILQPFFIGDYRVSINEVHYVDMGQAVSGS